MLPMDIIMHDISSGAQSGRYTGVVESFSDIYKREGIRGFWKGVGAPLLIDIPRRAIRFVVFDQTQPLFMFESKHPTLFTYGLAGGLGSIAEVLVMSPFEVIRNAQKRKEKLRKKTSTLTTAVEIIRHQGIGSKGLYRGVTTALLRNCAFHIAYFGFYGSVRDLTPAFHSTTLEFIRRFTIGYVAGALGCLHAMPFDVAKKRIQRPQRCKIKYRWTFSTMHTLCKEEGCRALFKGATRQIIRVAPASAILITGYEFSSEYLMRNYG
ncbi:CG5254 [Drosophila busckii]|uniref:Mitochondrial 2-oxodicarboxylate carrier n=1 Tax=Drosophila busckii TaxID=30019 RepID=A0A0M5J1H2_DROBS|nr:mitochondrial 2-oxodicarboxylate carrier-like [Drosophila busckii]ALC39031.1 CG5254 [Drosophila busckii]